MYSLLKLRNKEEIISGGDGKSVTFWSTKTFKKEYTVECCDCYSLNGLIELPNHYVAVNGGVSSTIDIIDTEHYQRIKQNKYKGYIVDNGGYFSSLHLLSNGTFIYSHLGCLCQISSITYEILKPIKMKNEFEGTTITSSLNGKYILAGNMDRGISTFKINYID